MSLLSAHKRYIGLTALGSGELLLDQQRYPDAIEKFDRAIEIERAKYVCSPIDFLVHVCPSEPSLTSLLL